VEGETMTIFVDFINQYGVTILYTLITAVFGFLGVQAKCLYNKYINDKTKKDVAHTVVKAVEQIYKDLHGDDKLNKAINSAKELFSEKGINITELELRLLIESAVADFNK
jgi:tyrosyl-tRNA synthetase